MNRNVWIAIVAAGAFGTVTGCGVPGERAEAIREAAKVHGELTVGGCLQHDPRTGQFVLTNAILPEAQAGIPVRDGTERPPMADVAPSTIGTVPPVLEGPRYVIQSPADVPLHAAYSGTQVQVTGTLRDPEHPVGTTGTDPALQPGMPPGADLDGYILANEVRLVADTCL